MTHQKTGNSTGNTAPAEFVPRQNTSNSANIVRKAVLSLFLLFIMCTSYAQNTISIVSPTGAYYCGSVVTLEAPQTGSNNFFSWTADGGVRLREVGTTGTGTNALFVNSETKVEAIINGEGEVRVICSCGIFPLPITLTPSPATLNNVTFSATTPINQPNGIQTTKGWICLSNDGSTETITLTNPSPLNIFWVVSGGAVKVSETQSSGSSPFTASVTIATSGAGAGKGFIRAFVSDPCGTLTCDPALDIEILKDLQPNEIAGPTCLRNNNLDVNPITNIGTVVYSITDEFAGNAIFDWELLQGGVPVTNSNFGIRSQVLYGNSATIEYRNGVMPSDLGNFSLRVTNACGGSFTRDITVSPAKPVLAQTTYCVSNAVPTVETITLPALLNGQTYSVTPQGSVNWTTSLVGNQLTVTFDDAVSGAIEVRAASSSDPGCTSEGTLIYFNREGGTPTITGPTCVTRNTTDAFSFTASPFGQYTWTVSPALPADFVTSSGGNVFTVSPPAGGINVSGSYTVTATLAGCSSVQNATFDFEIGPEKPTITNGLTCLGSGATTNYTVTSAGAVYYIATVTPNGGSPVVSSPFPIATPYSYTGTSQDASISITSYSSTGCASLPTVIDVKAKPSVTAINADNLCISFGETPTVTFTAVSTGTISDYTWTKPAGWNFPAANTGGVYGGNGYNFITLKLDANTAGDVCVTPSNGTCLGEQFCLNIPRNALAITLVRTGVPNTPFSTITATANTNLLMDWRYGQDQSQVTNCGGTLYGALATGAGTTTSSYFYVASPNPNPWISLKLVDPVTGCERCIVVELSSIPTTTTNYKVAADSKINTSIDLNVYPNPVENILNVKVSKDVKVSQTYLVDAKGIVVFQSTEMSNTQKIDVSKFAKGMYYLAIVTDKGIQGKKIIIE
ncbi:T9SS type A sorting domain-containing protein [Bernardetia sp. OM2101]|uniref:T9SS type A sorting domain-containing protein n=1 Tax=Bernardetia sp. OM2101 TaxID=3344876 RepID=UPI0035CEE436